MYSLLRACSIVRSTDDTSGRIRVFNSVLRNSWKIRYSYYLYQAVPKAVKAALVLIYGLKCYLSVKWKNSGRSDVVFFASYINERIVIDHVRRNLDTLRQGEIAASLRNCIGLDSLLALPAFLPLGRRLYRLAMRLVRRHDFMPACRIISTVTYYLRHRRLLAGSAARAVFIANHYSPECLSLAAAAHRAGKKVLFTNHVNATGETGYVPPLHADLVAVTSQALSDVYSRHTPKRLDVVHIPMALPQRAMRLPPARPEQVRFGIFLTALTDIGHLVRLTGQIAAAFPGARVLIRQHPARVVNDDLSAAFGGNPDVAVSRATALADDIDRCDIVIVGNSTATIEVLRGGRPVLYDRRIDRLPYDYNGYVGQNLILPVPSSLDATIFDRVERFYGSAAWLETMRYFDCGYRTDETALLAGFRRRVEATLHESPRDELVAAR